MKISAMHAAGVNPARFLLPAGGDMSKWSVIACDPFTSQREYWEALDRFVGDAPSALRLILPEAYLEDADSDEKIAAAVRAMEDDVSRGVLQETKPGFVAIERTIASGVRRGVVCTIDLECYDPAGRGSIRPTEGTIASRVPPRMRVRKNAPLELSHVMLLCDDREDTFFGAVRREAEALSPVYDFELSMDGGHLRGVVIDDESALCRIDAAFAKAQAESAARNGENAPFLVVGDGNHSLAAAKGHWENLKAAGAAADHPARYAMVEIVNIHDPAVVFAPIHRAVFGTTREALGAALAKAANARGYAAGFSDEKTCEGILVPCMAGEEAFFFHAENPQNRWAVHVVQELLDDALKTLPNAQIDYIHGDETLASLCRERNAIGFFLPNTDKDSFFRIIGDNGALPRKTFSIGTATQKRYYTEARAIR